MGAGMVSWVALFFTVVASTVSFGCERSGYDEIGSVGVSTNTADAGSPAVYEPPKRRRIYWAGHIWEVSRGWSGPGPNRFDDRNVSVDDDGGLRLRVTQREGDWTCVGLSTTTKHHFGRYQWMVDGALDRLDKNVVLGLFTYPTPDVGPDTTNEIDIEIARWGRAELAPLNYNVWPRWDDLEATGRAFPMTLFGTATTHRFDWNERYIDFGSYHGFRSDDVYPIAEWSYQPWDYRSRIPQEPVPVNINLWLFQGHAPSDGQDVEVTIRDFRHTSVRTTTNLPRYPR